MTELLEEHDPAFVVGTCSGKAAFEKEVVTSRGKILLAQVGPDSYYENGANQYLFGLHLSSLEYTEPALKLLAFAGAKTVAIAGRAQSSFFYTPCSSAKVSALAHVV